jgi:Trk K+ transport system NAD-binding subunit
LRLDILLRTWPIALLLFGVRLVGIFIGSYSGGTLAGDPPKFNRLAWMAFITQAGVGLGLAKNIADEFPEWGPGFATIMIAVIVLNQIVGPPFFKAVIRRVKESHLPPLADPDEILDVLILGIEPQSMALARQLKTHHWKVVLADTDRSHVHTAIENGERAHWLPSIDEEELGNLIDTHTDAVIAMLDDDHASYKSLEIAYETFGIPRLIVRLKDMTTAARFASIGALVVNPASAMVNMLDQFVRAPQSAALLLHYDPEYEMLQVKVCDKDFEGISLRDLRLPEDVLVIGITRSGHSIVPHGYTILHVEDEVSLVGNPPSLEQIALRFGQ